MCDPTTLLITGATISAGSSVAQGISANSSARANAAMLGVQQQRRESKLALDLENSDRKFRTHTGAVQQKISVSGLTQGSFSDIIASDATERAMEVETLRWNAQNDVDNIEYQKSSELSRGRSAMAGGIINAVGTAVNSGSSYYKMTGLGDTGTAVNSIFSKPSGGYYHGPVNAPNYGNFTY